MRIGTPVRLLSALAVLLLGGGLGGCSTYRGETSQLRAAWAQGQVENASASASAGAEDADGTGDAVIWRLEEGSTLRVLNRFGVSNESFNQAAARIAQYDREAEVRLLDETKANFTNQSYLPYTGYDYDRIMLNTYQALNYLQSADVSSARVALNRAYESQREAVQNNASALAAANQLADTESRQATSRQAGKTGYNVNRARRDQNFNRALDSQYGYLTGMTAYADYVNPFSVFLDGLIRLTNPLEANDLERARTSFDRAAQMVPGNPYLAAEAEAALAAQAGRPVAPQTYVIFETGMAPSRDQIRIDIPLFIATSEVPYVGVAFPQLKFNPDYLARLTAEADGKSYPTALLCDVDAVVATEFKQRLDEVVIKTLISAGTKAAAQYGLQQTVPKDSAGYIAMAVIGSLYQASMNDADLRTWVTLPKQFQYCRLPTPASGALTLRGAGTPVTIRLRPDATNLVYIKSNSRACPLFIQLSTLRPLEAVPPPSTTNPVPATTS